jgi:hypothetical protein
MSQKKPTQSTNSKKPVTKSVTKPVTKPWIKPRIKGPTEEQRNKYGSKYAVNYANKDNPLINRYDYTETEDQIIQQMYKAKESLRYLEDHIFEILNDNDFKNVRHMRTQARKVSLYCNRLREWMLRRMREKWVKLGARDTSIIDDLKVIEREPKREGVFDYKKGLNERRRAASAHLKKCKKK